MNSDWIYGGSGDLFPDLTWENRPDMTGSEAPEILQNVWVAVMLATREKLSAITPGSCFVTALAAAPVIQALFDKTAVPCAGYAGFVDEHGRGEWGFRWAAAKWSDWIDRNAGLHLLPWQDVHCWVETATHVVDLSTDRDGKPLLYRPKWQMPKHPREARGQKPGEHTILLWRNPEALQVVQKHVGEIVPPITARAFEILAGHKAN
jgi:hypothetical protein